MPVAFSTVVTRVRRAFNDVSDATILDYGQEVNDDLLTMLNLREDTEDINLTAGTIEYALDEDIRKVLYAELRKSATDIRPMRGVDKSQLRGAWRDGARSDPSRYYISGSSTGSRVIGFTPTPVTTTSAGYPIVRLYVTRKSTLTLVGNILTGISSADVYVFGINARLCADSKREERDFWRAEYQRKLAEERALFWSQNADSPPSIGPNFYSPGPV